MGTETFPARQAQGVAERQALAPLLVNEVQARAMLGNVSAKSMFNWRKSAGLPFLKLGSRVMYSPADLAAWIQRQKGVDHE
jgi:hypothetical protein